MRGRTCRCRPLFLSLALGTIEDKQAAAAAAAASLMDIIYCEPLGLFLRSRTHSQICFGMFLNE